MTTVLLISEEKLYADCIFSALLSQNLPDSLNLIHLSLTQRLSSGVNLGAVDIIIYDFRGFDKNVISLVQRIRKQNPHVYQLNLISEGDTVVRTDPNIEYLNRHNGLDMMAEIIRTFIVRRKKNHTPLPTLQSVTKREKCMQSVTENLARLSKLDVLFSQGDKQGYIALYRDILEVAFNQTLVDPDITMAVVKIISAYLYSFFYRNKLDVLFSQSDFLYPLSNPTVSEKQISRIFLKISDLAGAKSPSLNESVTVLRAKEHIKKNLFNDLSLTQVADQLKLNPSYLSRVFKEDTGQSMSEYIAKLKIDYAKGYLLSKDITVNDISLKLGFRSVNYFIRFFKKHTGLPPSAWREKVASR